MISQENEHLLLFRNTVVVDARTLFPVDFDIVAPLESQPQPTSFDCNVIDALHKAVGWKNLDV